MPTEIEAKLALEGPEPLRRRLREAGAEAAGAVREVNRLYDDPALTLRRRGAALRLRENRDPDSGETRTAVITFKGPVVEGPMKRREEHETPVSSAEAMAAVLEATGLSVTFHYEKDRETWHLGPAEVVLDHVPHLGWYVEVEAPDEGAVRKALKTLGLDPADQVPGTYVELLVAHLEATNRDPSRAVFADEGPPRAPDAPAGKA